MFAGIVIGASLVLGGLLVVQAGRSRNGPDGYFISFAIIGVAVAGVATTVALRSDGNPDEAAASTLGGIAFGDAARAASSLNAPVTIAPQTTRLAPVPSLIEGLSSRLETEADDMRGWALLAQSYAFVGQPEAAERALLRAVELGYDEADLRVRVDGATRDPHAGVAGFPGAN